MSAYIIDQTSHQEDAVCLTHTFLLLQLSRSGHAAVLPARRTDGPPHRRLPSRPLDGDLPRAARLPRADALPGHHVSTGQSRTVQINISSDVSRFTTRASLCRPSYCSPEYTFPRQQEVINFAANRAFELVTLHPRTLVVCGSYSVGKEKVFLGERG